MNTRGVGIAVGALAAAGLAIWWLDRRNAAAAGAVTVDQAGAVASTGLGWWSPFLPLQLQTVVARSIKSDTLKV